MAGKASSTRRNNCPCSLGDHRANCWSLGFCFFVSISLPFMAELFSPFRHSPPKPTSHSFNAAHILLTGAWWLLHYPDAAAAHFPQPWTHLQLARLLHHLVAVLHQLLLLVWTRYIKRNRRCSRGFRQGGELWDHVWVII